MLPVNTNNRITGVFRCRTNNNNLPFLSANQTFIHNPLHGITQLFIQKISFLNYNIHNLILGGSGSSSTPPPSGSTLPNPGGSAQELTLEIDQSWSQEPSGYTRSD